MARSRSAARTAPVGLAGEFTTIAFVRGPSRPATASGEYWNPSSSATGTVTGTPSAYRTKFG